MSLTTLITLWVVVTTAVVVLAYMRMSLGLHDILDMHLTGSRPGIEPDDARRFKRMEKLDRFGIPLTVLSAVMAVAIVLLWAMQRGSGS